MMPDSDSPYGLVANSEGHFDNDEYQRQLEFGLDQQN